MNEIERTEKTILGSILSHGNNCLYVFSLIKSFQFSIRTHQILFECLSSLNDKGSGIDLSTLIIELRAKNSLDSVGGIVSVSSLTDYVSYKDLTPHCLFITEEYIKRQMKLIGNKITSKADEVAIDCFDIIEEADKMITELLNGVVKNKTDDISKISHSVLLEMESVLSTGKRSGVNCGIERLNNQTNGWQRSDLIILAGRPGMGKTSAAIDFCLTPAIQNTPAVFFSLEMSKEQLTGRILSIISGINVQKIINKQVNNYELEHIKESSNILKNIPLYIDDTPSLSLIDLKNKARLLKKEKGIELIVIDYLQLMVGKNKQNREQEVNEISRGLKSLAKELNIPIIALAQLNRNNEARTDKKPMLSDLRDSGAIEQDADMVIFCHRPEYYEQQNYFMGNEELPTLGLFVFIISKFRNGSTGEIRAKFIHENTKVTNYV